MFPSLNSRMPRGINLLYYRELVPKSDLDFLFDCSFRHLILAWPCDYRKHGMDKSALRSVGLASRVNLSAEIGRSGSGFRKVTREDGLDEGAENDLSTTTSY